MVARVRIVGISMALLASAQVVHAQAKTSSTPVPVQFMLPQSAFALSGTSVQAVFPQEVPVGKRLVVQHVSVSFFALDVNDEPAASSCEFVAQSLDVNGNAFEVRIFIPLTGRREPTASAEGFVGGQEVT